MVGLYHVIADCPSALRTIPLFVGNKRATLREVAAEYVAMYVGRRDVSSVLSVGVTEVAPLSRLPLVQWYGPKEVCEKAMMAAVWAAIR